VDANLEGMPHSKSDGSRSIPDLPNDMYDTNFVKHGLETPDYPQLVVQRSRTTTVNPHLQPAADTSRVTVERTPLSRETDTTNGYTLDSDLIENIPLGTGSFTQLALLAPGVNADLLAGAGTNAGLGNQDIFANGQRDTSNSFSFNSVESNIV